MIKTDAGTLHNIYGGTLMYLLIRCTKKNAFRYL